MTDRAHPKENRLSRRAFAKMAAGVVACTSASSTSSMTVSSSDANPLDVQFVDVTKQSGILFTHERAASPDKLLVEVMGPGCAWLDYNNDGLLDALFINSGRTPNFHPFSIPQPKLFRNNGDGSFTDVSATAGLKISDGFFIGAAVGDYNNDGFPDIYMTGYGRSLLFRNNGDGTFSDVTDATGVANPGEWATAAGWFDFDHDGHLDLLVANYVHYDWEHDPYCGSKLPGSRTYCDPFHFKGSRLRLYRNNGNGTFSDWTERSGLATVWGKGLGLVLADFDGDGWDDILVANDGMQTFLFLNQKNGTFRDATFESGVGFGGNGEIESGMGIDAGDVTGKGNMDFYICHMDAQLNRLYRNDGKAEFADVTTQSGLGRSNWQNTSFAARIVDWDNDGNRDILVVNGSMLDNIALFHPESSFSERKTLYRNIGSGRFVDATSTQNGSFQVPFVGRGLAVGDYDNDGALDFLQSNNGGPGQLFQNRGGEKNHWIGLKLEGTRSNRDAVGARASLRSDSFTSVDQIKGGMSYCSAQDLRLYFGLGNRVKVDSLEICWPSGLREYFKDMSVDRIYVIKEGYGILPFQFPRISQTKRI
jgi:enediyne biosynthesis protein E4